MVTVEELLQELEQEARTTHRVLERVPGNKLDWRPHEKARTLGQLAMHVAIVPGVLAQLITSPTPAQMPQFKDPPLNSIEELLPALKKSVETVKAKLSGLDEAGMAETWRLMMGDKEIFALPRAVLLRSMVLNHWYHHRGQLAVYLKELDVPIPSIYGPSADENPFAG